MILHIYHCNLAMFRDYRTSPGTNRPAGTQKFPPRPNVADIHFVPPTEGFGDRLLSQLLKEFQVIEIPPAGDAAIRINWRYLRETLGVEQDELMDLFAKARALGLLGGLTISYDHERWMRHNRTKGCFVVMTYIERADLQRDAVERSTAFCEVIDKLRKDVLSKARKKSHGLRHVFVIPNGHLAPRQKPVDSSQAIEVLRDLTDALASRGYKARLNSYGYSKVIQLGINAHKLGYVSRVA